MGDARSRNADPRRQGAAIRALPYRKPTPDRDYWVFDDVLPDAHAVRARLLAGTEWSQGYPHRAEAWPGMRAMPALLPGELEAIEARVMAATGSRRLWVESSPEIGRAHV